MQRHEGDWITVCVRNCVSSRSWTRHSILLRQVWHCFLARDSIYAVVRYMPSPVRLSVTRVDQSKTFEVRITQPSPQSSPMTLVSWRFTSPCYSKGKIGSGASNKRGVWKIRNFLPSAGIVFRFTMWHCRALPLALARLSCYDQWWWLYMQLNDEALDIYPSMTGHRQQ